MMLRLGFGLFGILCLSGLWAKTNVVVFLTDDQGWGDLSLHGNTNLSTPHIDSLGKEGATFDRFFVCPVCSPTRAEFLTGRYHVRSGVYSTSAGGERMDLDETTIADLFKKAGYSTGAFGKWHNGMQYPYHPLGRGFDYFYGFCSGHWGHYYDALMERNGELVKGKGFCVDDFTTEAINFIDRSVKDEKPFFAYVPYNTPHSPMQVPDRWWNKFKDKNLEDMMRHRNPSKEDRLHLLAALVMCENIDWNVGRLLNKLDQLKVADDTIVIFFHDNGPNGNRWNGDMEGRKGSDSQVSRFVPVRSDPRKHRRRETATAARRTIAGSRTRNGGAGHEQKPENEREALGELHGFSVALVRSLYVRARGTGAAASADWGQMTRFRPCDWLRAKLEQSRQLSVKRGFLDSTFPVRSAPKRVAARTGPFDFIRGRVV